MVVETLRAHAFAWILVAVAASATVAQEASPTVEPLPYADYSAALDGFSAAASSVMEDLGPASTVSDVTAAYRQSMALVRQDQRRLMRVTPEPCYAAAHDEILAYRQAGIELFERNLPQMADSRSLTAVRALLESMDTELYLRHPIAYLGGRDPDDAFGGSVGAIAAAMVTCQDREPPWLAGPVEMMEHRFALSLPAGWIGIDMGGPIDAQLKAVIERFGAEPRPVHKADVRAAIARSEGLADWLVIIDTATGDSCGFLGGPNRTGVSSTASATSFSRASSGTRR